MVADRGEGRYGAPFFCHGTEAKMTERDKIYWPYMEISKDCRLTNNRTQTKVAATAGLSTKYISLLESGRRVPTLENVIAISAASGVSKATAIALVMEYLDTYNWEA